MDEIDDAKNNNDFKNSLNKVNLGRQEKLDKLDLIIGDSTSNSQQEE